MKKIAIIGLMVLSLILLVQSVSAIGMTCAEAEMYCEDFCGGYFYQSQTQPPEARQFECVFIQINWFPCPFSSYERYSGTCDGGAPMN